MLCCCRCDKITISPQLLSELQSSNEPLPRKLSPDMTHSQDSKVSSFSADVFNSLHGGDQMAVDKLKQVGVSYAALWYSSRSLLRQESDTAYGAL